MSYAPGAATSQTVSETSGDSTESASGLERAFSSLLGRGSSPMVLFLAILLAVLFGAVHALGPGHGKTVMAVYLVGAGGRARQAVIVGIAVSLMHTSSVLLLGLITLWASNVFAPEQVYPWLSLASGVIVLGLGSWLLQARVKARRAAKRPVLLKRLEIHGHDHAPGSKAALEHARAHAAGLDHSHGTLPEDVPLLSWKGLGAIAVSGGLLPSPSALVVFLGAVALHRVAFGLTLVAAFSVGLAGALMIIGLLVLKARDVAQRRFRGGFAPVLQLLSAGAIVLVGSVLTLQAMVNLPI